MKKKMPDHELADNEYLIQTHDSKISKVDVILMIFFWMISAWGYVAQHLIDDDDGRISEDAKYWIGMTIPITTSLAALFKSIQVGMEIKDDHVLRRSLRNTVTNNININASAGADIDLTMASSSSTCEEENMDNKRSHKNFLARNPSVKRIQVHTEPNSAPTVLFLGNNHSSVAVSDDAIVLSNEKNINTSSV